MDKWDQAKLNEVVASKQGNENRNLPTKIVCKYFIDAIESNKYGWFWECPNGGKKCQYQHALPPGISAWRLLSVVRVFTARCRLRAQITAEESS
jgi:hypothetical protein